MDFENQRNVRNNFFKNVVKRKYLREEDWFIRKNEEDWGYPDDDTTI